MENTHHNFYHKVVERATNFTVSSCDGIFACSRWLLVPWIVIWVITLPLLLFVAFLIFFICIEIQLAIDNVGRVIFVLVASFMAYYQVPHTAFYVYISVVIFSGFL